MDELVDEGRRHFIKQLSLTAVALLPATRAMAQLVEPLAADPLAAPAFLIDAAFRLTHYQQLLELEFYFLNVHWDDDQKKLLPLTTATARYQSYMVVRLPQQHIAEEYVDATTLQQLRKHLPPEKSGCPPPGQQKSRISGYSFLCFHINFSAESLRNGLTASAAELMNWNAGHFLLMSKQDNGIKPFIYDELGAQDSSADPATDQLRAPSIYPLSFLSYGTPTHFLRYGRAFYPNERNFPGSLGLSHRQDIEDVRKLAPITTLEFPYRLLINPRLPSAEYESRWVFTSLLSSPATGQPVELWMATLLLVKKNSPHQERNAQSTGSGPGGTPGRAPAAGSQELINQGDNQLQLLVLGPAGAHEYRIGKVTSRTDPAPTGDQPPAGLGIRTLPDGQDRLDLTRLGGLGIAATAPSLTFTPLGVSVQLVLQNRDFEKDRIALYQWKQAISFGRDQEVEVANVVMEVPCGLKMLHVRTTRRETYQGRALLIYREFLQPLEMEKDFASYNKQDVAAEYQQANYKYATPFQRVRFPDANPRQILPLAKLGTDLCVRREAALSKALLKQQREASAAVDSVTAGATPHTLAMSRYKADKHLRQREDQLECLEKQDIDAGREVLAFWGVTPDQQLLEWPLLCTDWLGRETLLPRRLYLLKSELFLDRDDKRQPAYPYPDDPPTLDSLGSELHDALLPDADDTVPPARAIRQLEHDLTHAMLQLELNAGAVAEALPLLLQRPNTDPEALRKVFKALCQVNGNTGTRQQSDIELALKALGETGPRAEALAGELSKKFDQPTPWQRIRHQSEEGRLHALDVLRGSLDQQLQRAEKLLVALSTQGQRDAEDLVLEEWGRFKRRMLTLEDSWEGELRRLRHQAAGLLHEVHQYLLVSGAALAGIDTLCQKLVQLVAYLDERIQSVVHDGIENLDLATLKLAQTPPTVLLNQAAQEVQGAYTEVINLLQNKPSIPAIDPAVFDAVLSTKQQLLTELQQRQEWLLRQEAAALALGPAFEQRLFVCRLPEKLWAEMQQQQYLVQPALHRLRLVAGHIHQLEAGLKSRIEAGQASICYAVHQTADEMEVLKKALDAKWIKARSFAADQVRKQQEWITDYNRLSRDFGEAASGHLATLRTKYLLLRGNLRLLKVQVDAQAGEKARKVLDIFDPYGCYPSTHTLAGYDKTIDGLVRRDVLLKIKPAAEYLQHQLDNFVLEVEGNAARVVAEVHTEARELLQGAMREASRDLGGLVSLETGAHYLTLLKDGSQKAQDTLDALRRDSRELVDQLENARDQAFETANQELNSILMDYQAGATAARQEFNKLRQGVGSLTRQAKQQLQVAAQDAQVSAQAFLQGLETKILGSIRLRDLLGSNFDLPKLQRLPDKVTYQLLARDFKPFDVKVFRFVPHADTTLTTYLEVPTRSPENFHSETRLSNFTLSIFEDRLLVEFRKIELLSNRQVRNKPHVELGAITLGKELEFLAALSKGFAIPGTGLRVIPAPDRVTVTYALPIPGVTGGAFTFDNLKLNAGVTIPLPTGLGSGARPVGIRFGLNTPTDEFALGVLIFGGKGHFQIEATPKYLSQVDIGLSFGGLFRINLVIASGEAFLQAGIRYVYSREATGETYMELYGILSCGANVTVFGFIDISVVFTMYLKYRQDNEGSAMYGVASVACSVRIGFFSKLFSLSFSQRIAGSPAGAPAPAPPPAPLPPTRRLSPLPPVAQGAEVSAPLPPRPTPPQPLPTELPPQPTSSARSVPDALPPLDSSAYRRVNRRLSRIEDRLKQRSRAFERRKQRNERRLARLGQLRRERADVRARADYDMHARQNQQRVLSQLLSQLDCYASPL